MMKICIYTGGAGLVRKSGIGQAICHQQEQLRRLGISTTDCWTADTSAIHINTVLPDAVVAALWAKVRGRKVIWYGHSTMEDFRGSFKASDALAPLFRRWICFCYNLGDVIITPTEYARCLLESYGLRRPVYSLSNGVDTAFFRPDPALRSVFRSRYGLKETDRVVMSVGHTIARKGLIEFLELARQMPRTRFMWFGWTDPRLIPRTVRQCMAHAPENVSFPGYVDRERLREAYCGADSFVFMSREETEGIVVLEALACQTPTIIRNIPVYQDWLTDGENVYKASNIQSFREKLEGLLRGTLPDLTSAGRKVACQRSFSAVGIRLLDIYRKEKILPPASASPVGVSL